MCGIAGMAGHCNAAALERMSSVLRHRGPDDEGLYLDPLNRAGLAHRRLSIIDLSKSGRQPMSDPSGRYHLVYNGEIYNYLELRQEIGGRYTFSTRTDSEVLLAAYATWGSDCLDRLIGMFAFAIWDEREGALFVARDRFGVKPVYLHETPDGGLLFASEIKALHEVGVAREPDPVGWATYLTYGLYDHLSQTFWKDIESVPAGHALLWKEGRLTRWRWYDLAERVPVAEDRRSAEEVLEEYRGLLDHSLQLRFRSDVPVGINLSGGLDSCTLLGLVDETWEDQSEVATFTFFTGEEQYDELPWTRRMVEHTDHPLYACRTEADDIPELAARVQRFQDEPFGGIPTLAYSRIFERARSEGFRVLLDGQGMDEQWAGYEYYVRASTPDRSKDLMASGPVQGARDRSVRPECLIPAFRELAQPFNAPCPFPDELRNMQYRDAFHAKIPRAVRFNDRISMMHSVELREPFLDHRLFELALSQPTKFKIRNGETKWLLRRLAEDLVPKGLVLAPKRPLQTPQREWIAGRLRAWVEDHLERVAACEWLESSCVWGAWERYLRGESDNSFYVWQWVSLSMMIGCSTRQERVGRGLADDLGR